MWLRGWDRGSEVIMDLMLWKSLIGMKVGSSWGCCRNDRQQIKPGRQREAELFIGRYAVTPMKRSWFPVTVTAMTAEKDVVSTEPLLEEMLEEMHPSTSGLCSIHSLTSFLWTWSAPTAARVSLQPLSWSLQDGIPFPFQLHPRLITTGTHFNPS